MTVSLGSRPQMASLVETVSGVARWAKSSVGAGIDAVTPSALTSGAIDVIVVEQADGSTLMCTPFHVRTAASRCCADPRSACACA